MPNLISCEFCSRLYSIYSLKHHHPKCSENPVNARPVSATPRPRRRNTTSGRSKSNSRQSESRKGMKRSKSVGSSQRPDTHTVNSHIGVYRSREDEVEKRPCFVCGKFYKLERLDSHRRRCESDWEKARSGMPNFIRTNHPISVQIPSIDGSSDSRRIDQLAIISAERAQSAVCIRCSITMGFGEAITHRCPRKEPTIEFFF